MKFCFLLLAFSFFAFADPAVDACRKLEKHGKRAEAKALLSEVEQ